MPKRSAQEATPSAQLSEMMGAWSVFWREATRSGDEFLCALQAMGEGCAKASYDTSGVLNAQLGLWQDYQQLWMRTTSSLLLGPDGPRPSPVVEPEPHDSRFRAADWNDNPIFDYIKQAYLLNAAWVSRMVESIEGLDPDVAQKVDFYSRQLVDALAPTNFALTNPTVLRETIETKGENLRQGYQNLAESLGKGKGPLALEQTDETAFEVGGNIAITPGEVVFQNELFQLIQYAPTTETVYKRPLLIIPPWINKFYILDLRPENSFIRWCLDKGYTVLVISWVNPDERHRDKSFDDYARDGILAALEAIEQATGERKVNAIGYCIGGTLLAMTLAYLGARGEQRIRSATFFAAQIDFAQGGELRVFTDAATLEAIEDDVQRKGYLEGAAMASAFNMLRANDLIWHFVINNYLMGKAPRAFDLLYWNADSTRFPARLLFDYVRCLYQENQLCTPGAFELLGQPIDLADIEIPVYIQASRQDHIAPAESVYKAMRSYSGSKRFVLAGSGHIAGVINPPAKNKYQHWVNPRKKNYASLEKWLAKATEVPGSWWPDWHEWLSKKSGRRVAARVPGTGGLPAIEPAPGAYVKMRC